MTGSVGVVSFLLMPRRGRSLDHCAARLAWVDELRHDRAAVTSALGKRGRESTTPREGDDSPEPYKGGGEDLDSVRELVGRAVARDPAAQAMIFDLHATRLHGLARRFVHSREAAEDLLQDTFIRAFEKLHELKNPASLGPWLSQMLVRRAISFLRREKVRQRIGLTTVVDDEKLPPLHGSPLEGMIAEQEARRLLGEMPADTRVVWWLQRVEGHTINEVAALTGFSIDKVKKRLSAGERMLEPYRQQRGDE